MTLNQALMEQAKGDLEAFEKDRMLDPTARALLLIINQLDTLNDTMAGILECLKEQQWRAKRRTD